MMAYFKGFNFVRAITLLSLIGACVLGWFDWKQYQELRALRPALEPNGQIEQLCQELQMLAHQYTQLDAERQGEGFLAQANPEEYIRSIKSNAGIGQVKTDINSQPARSLKGVTDFTYKITPDPPNSPVSRTKIKEFMSRLEENSQRIRVTNLDVRNAQANVRPNEVPEDKWTFTCTLTSRQKTQ
jgi:hypothetical protein